MAHMTPSTYSIAYISLGSNLSAPVTQLEAAIAKLSNTSDLDLLMVSAFYQSTALTLPGTSPQPDYINAAAKLSTTLSPQQLLHKLHEIEALQGRQRIEKWAARTLDLDLLLYDDMQIQSESLNIPHGQMAQRNFVIYPLYEIAGDLAVPGLGPLSELAAALSWQGLKRLDSKHT